MKRLLCPRLPSPDNSVTLPPGEEKHARVVLRLTDGESIMALDGKGHAVIAILKLEGSHAILKYESALSQPEVSRAENQVVPVILELAVLKGEAMEWAIEKAVELGVDEFIPILTAHTVVRLDRKGPQAFQERWQKIADQALKQCGRFKKMNVQAPLPLSEVLKRHPSTSEIPRIWCDEAGANQSPYLASWLAARFMKGTRLLIGPEGGWSDQERAIIGQTADRVSLGPLILRAETAAVFAASLCCSFFRAMKLDSNTQLKGS